MQEANERQKQEGGKDGAHDAAHAYLLLVADEGCGYDVCHQQEIDNHIEGQVCH